MTTGWKRLTRRDLSTFDKFATEAVLTAMELGGVGRIATSGHAKIRGKNGASMMVARDTSAPHCQGNVTAALKRTFPELKTNDATKKDETVTPARIYPKADAAVQEMVECPAKGCDLKFPTPAALDTHVHVDHFVCKWEGCDYGPGGGPYVGAKPTSIAGHVNVIHKGNKPWEKNQEQAAIKRAKTNAAKKAALATVAANQAANAGLITRAAEQAADFEAKRAQVAAVPVTSDIEQAHSDAEAKLALVQEILGEDPRIEKLEKEVAHLKAQLALVREAAGFDFEADSK